VLGLLRYSVSSLFTEIVAFSFFMAVARFIYVLVNVDVLTNLEMRKAK